MMGRDCHFSVRVSKINTFAKCEVSPDSVFPPQTYTVEFMVAETQPAAGGGSENAMDDCFIKVVVYSMNDNYHVFSKIHKNFKKYVS